MKPHRRPHFQIAEPVGKKAFLYPVQAEIERSIGARRRGDGIGSGVLLAVSPRVLDGDKLARYKAKLVDPIYLKFKMLGLRR